MPARDRSPWWLLLRVGLYGALQLGLMYLHLRRTTDGGTEASARAWLAEGGTIEWLQVAVLALALVVMVIGPARRGTLGVILALALLATIARELDATLTATLWKNAHRAIMIALGIAAAALALWPRGRLHEQLGRFLGSPAFWLMGFGLALVVIYALILGQNTMWLPHSAPGFDRITKRFVEEGLELSGYVWILFGALELAWAARGPRQAPGPA